MGTHDNEISTTHVCHTHDSFRRGPGSDFCLPGTLEAIEHEVTQARQGLLIVILAYNGGLWRE
jgi:hypothetical protein